MEPRFYSVITVEILDLIKDCIKITGNQAALARELSTEDCKISPQLVWMWLNRNKYIWSDIKAKLQNIKETK